jgi:uncharacterized protein
MTDATQPPELTHPWLIAVWPGMGQVAISGGYYLLAKLGMHEFAEFSPQGLFDLEHVEVKGGLIRSGQLPRSRFFAWKDPQGRNDIVVFIGEAQPPAGKYAFCLKLLEFAQELGVERVFTFAAMATEMHPEHDSRVFGAATDEDSLAELKRLELEIISDGHIGGLNGVLLGVAAEQGLRGCSLLGEIPHVFAQFPFPKASLAVLQAFTTMADLTIEFSELAAHARAVEEQLGQILARVEKSLTQQGPEEEESGGWETGLDVEEPSLSEDDRQRIDRLFEQARQDRSRAYELKAELDRLDVFSEYEDRFLDLFRNSG